MTPSVLCAHLLQRFLSACASGDAPGAVAYAEAYHLAKQLVESEVLPDRLP